MQTQQMNTARSGMPTQRWLVHSCFTWKRQNGCGTRSERNFTRPSYAPSIQRAVNSAQQNAGSTAMSLAATGVFKSPFLERLPNGKCGLDSEWCFMKAAGSEQGGKWLGPSGGLWQQKWRVQRDRRTSTFNSHQFMATAWQKEKGERSQLS